METMIQRIIKIGKNLAVPLPEEAIKGLRLTEGDEVNVELHPERKQIVITLCGKSPDIGEIDREFAEQVTTFIRDYKPALEELAKLEG